MIFQFPVPHDGELLSSVLARFVTRQGVRDDKIALGVLFGSRNIVPSALLQGHLQDLLERVNHLWKANAPDVIEKHSILPVFKPFVEPKRYSEVCLELETDAKSHSMIKIGINASSVVFPTSYRYCPICLQEDLNERAYSYWRRQFQLPGVEVCLKHQCSLVESDFDIMPTRRHAFVDATLLDQTYASSAVSVCQDFKLILLAQKIDQLLSEKLAYILPEQWTAFYDSKLREVGLKSTKGVDHSQVESLLVQYWGNSFLSRNGLGLDGGVTWLKTFFRKQRKHFSYLHHFVCIQALFSNMELKQVFKEASKSKANNKKRSYFSSNAKTRAPEYRSYWNDLKLNYKTLKEIRSTKEGARVYSWLYRFDNSWLKCNLPEPARNNVYRVVDWKKRDLQVVKRLLRVRNESFENLSLPRMSRSWYIAQTKLSWGIDCHLDKLLLCRSFFVKYSETIEEYQIRRVLAIITNFINNNEPIPKRHEIERLAGLSKKRMRKPVKHILEMGFDQFSYYKIPSSKYRAYEG